MAGMDAFSGNAFSMQSLTAALLDRAHKPRRIGELGIFDAEGVRTTMISVERQKNTLVLVQTSPRNAPVPQSTRDGREIVDFHSVRVALEDTITADEVQDRRSFGSESEMQSLMGEVNRRGARLSDSIDVTEEYHRMGALKGQVLDADGSVLFDLFTKFGIAAQAEIDFDLDNASPASGALRTKCSQVIRLIEDELDGLMYDQIYCQCSSQFFDLLVAHPEYRANRLNWSNADELNQRTARRRTTFGGIVFEEYHGAIGGTKYVLNDKAHVFPIGVPDLYITRYSPAEYWETVNTIGLPRYSIINPDGTDPKHSRTLRVQSHPITLCTRPRVLIPARMT